MNNNNNNNLNVYPINNNKWTNRYNPFILPRPIPIDQQQRRLPIDYGRRRGFTTNPNNSILTSLLLMCRDRAFDCQEKLQLCTDAKYWRLMRQQCALSCEFCDPNT